MSFPDNVGILLRNVKRYFISDIKVLNLLEYNLNKIANTEKVNLIKY